MNKLLQILLLVATASLAQPLLAKPGTPAAKQAEKKAVKKKIVKKKTNAKAAAATPTVIPADDDDADDDTPMNIEGSNVTDFNCELGNKITSYTNPNDDKHLAIRWKGKLHRLRRIGTTTGANRFENRKYGLVWINIPSKAMLLDSKKGQQLANECRDPDQAKLYAQRN